MTNRADRTASGEHLSPRSWGVLEEIVRQYVFDGCPVSSQTIAEIYHERLSPASIRKVMAELEEAGLIQQPHVSAGRIPTDLGYRRYVDRFVETEDLSQRDRRAVESGLPPSGDLQGILDAASRLLSRLSRSVGVVVAPYLHRVTLRNIEFVRINDRRVLGVFVTDSGGVINRVVEVEGVPSQEELERFARLLVDEFQGMSLLRMRDLLAERLAAESRALDLLTRRAMDLGLTALGPRPEVTEVFVEGAVNLLGAAEGADLGRIRALLEALERKEEIVLLLDKCLERDGVSALIGSESGEADLNDLAIIAGCYRMGERPLGTLGIIGPTRMEYARNIALVGHVAGSLSAILTEAFE